MKSTKTPIFASLLLVLLLAVAQVAVAQTVQTVVTETPAIGTISEFNPDAIVIKSDIGPEPVRYYRTKTTTFVDESGNPVAVESVKTGLPVTVYYNKDGSRNVVTKVVVKKTKTKTDY